MQKLVEESKKKKEMYKSKFENVNASLRSIYRNELIRTWRNFKDHQNSALRRDPAYNAIHLDGPIN